jgi:predicted nucleotidyltransferase
MNQERKILIKALVGSHNYNLNDESSDKDYKLFVAPTFDDLYNNKMFSNSQIGKEVDYDIHDIRKIPELWWKTNINFVEVLFSNEIEFINPDDVNTIYEDVKIRKINALLNKMFFMKDEIMTMNLPYFFNACKGMYFNKMSMLEKGTEGTKHLVEKYGYDTKQALHSLRVMDCIIRFADNGFKDFKSAIIYDKERRESLLDIKNGTFNIAEFGVIASNMYNHFMTYEELYKAQPTKPNIKVEIDNIIKEIVKITI